MFAPVVRVFRERRNIHPTAIVNSRVLRVDCARVLSLVLSGSVTISNQRRSFWQDFSFRDRVMIKNTYMVQNEAVIFGSALADGRVLISRSVQSNSLRVGCNLFGVLPAICSANTVERGSRRRLTLFYDVASWGA